jgi:O-antigen ligase
VHTFADRITRYLWIASLSGLALFIPFSIAGANASIMLGFLASVIGIISLPSVRARYGEVKNDPMFWACIVLVVSAIPSVFMSENLSRAARDWKSYWILLVYFLVAYNLTSPRLRRVVYWILFTSLTVSCIVSVIQYKGSVDVFFVHIRHVPARPSSTLFIMTFAGILAQLITVNFTMMFCRGRAYWVWLVMITGLVVQVFGLLLTLTRGAWLGLFAGVITAAVLLRRRGPFIVTGALIAVIAIAAIGDDRVRQKVVSIPRNIHGATDFNVATRFVLYDVSWELIKTYPFFGVGMGDYSEEAERLLGGRPVETVTDSHNIYLQILVTRGIFGFVFFVFFWLVLLRMLVRMKAAMDDRQSFARHFVTGTIAATVALLVGALTENNIDDSEVFITFTFLVGMARSFTLFPDPTDGPSHREQPPRGVPLS